MTILPSFAVLDWDGTWVDTWGILPFPFAFLDDGTDWNIGEGQKE